MRSTENFHPEWGYLAPSPSFLRTLRIAVVATAIGATAGAGVVVSLVERSTADTASTSIASHALITTIHTAPAEVGSVAPLKTAPAVAAQSPVPMPIEPQSQQNRPSVIPPINGPAPQVTASEPSAASTQGPANVAALAVPGAVPARARDEAVLVPDASPIQKPATKKYHTAGDEERHGQWKGDSRKKWRHGGVGPLLRHLFSARTGSSYYPN